MNKLLLVTAATCLFLAQREASACETDTHAFIVAQA